MLTVSCHRGEISGGWVAAAQLLTHLRRNLEASGWSSEHWLIVPFSSCAPETFLCTLFMPELSFSKLHFGAIQP